MDYEEKLFEKLIRINKKKQEEYWKKNKEAREKNGGIPSLEDYLNGSWGQDEYYGNLSGMIANDFSKRMNCGGYALQVDGCFFPNGDKLSGYVSALLDEFDFVRLLGDKPIQDDEYLVFYRVSDYEESKGRVLGHHFIKVNDDNMVVEKCGGDSPRIFQGWPESFKDSPYVAFAVKRDHDEMIGDLEQIWGEFFYLKKGLDFEDSVMKALEERSNLFDYHCRRYMLKKSDDGEIFIANEEGEIVADLLVDDSDSVVVVRAGKEDYVENYCTMAEPIIENGRLVNVESFKENKSREELDR